MTATIERWAGEFGNEYLDRNLVDWPRRIPFFTDLRQRCPFFSALEVGCNAGWNLLALNASGVRKPFVRGIDINGEAIERANALGLDVRTGSFDQIQWLGEHDLVFTVGVLIHVPPEDLESAMRCIVRAARSYVLAVEYEGETEEEIEYRGEYGLLWRRPFGKLYEQMGLKLVREWDAGPAFDRCTAWLMEKP